MMADGILGMYVVIYLLCLYCAIKYDIQKYYHNYHDDYDDDDDDYYYYCYYYHQQHHHRHHELPSDISYIHLF